MFMLTLRHMSSNFFISQQDNAQAHSKLVSKFEKK